jgi:hypothetical protein
MILPIAMDAPMLMAGFFRDVSIAGSVPVLFKEGL